jgi:hypothetical protein
MFELTQKELSLLKRLNTPSKIQTYLESIPFNWEKKGETCMSPRRVMEEKRAHCIEGALFAAAVLWVHKKDPLVMRLRTTDDDQDHVIALFKENGYWGAISKTNHAVLRYRDPIYKTLRELALSYFHEYFLISNGKKTLRFYSKPINLKDFGSEWLTADKDLVEIDAISYHSATISILPTKKSLKLRHATGVERKSGSFKEWNTKDKKEKY